MWKVGRLLNAAAFDAVSRFRALPSAAVLDARRARRSRPTHGPHAPFLASARVLDDVPRGSLVACRSRLGCKLPYPAEIRRRTVRSRVAGDTPLYLKMSIWLALFFSVLATVAHAEVTWNQMGDDAGPARAG